MEELFKAALADELTDAENQQYAETADQLCKSIGGCSKVHPVVFIDAESKERTVCYLKEPNYATKIRVMDKTTTIGLFSAADELREACTIKEHSSPITYGDGPECDKYKMGVTDYCLTIVNRMRNQFKKK